MDIIEIIKIFISIVSGLISVIWFLVWRILRRIEEKLEEVHNLTHSCREALPERFVHRAEFEQQQALLTQLWQALNYHEHDLSGRVVR